MSRLIRKFFFKCLFVFKIIVCKIKSNYYNSYIDEGNGKFIVQHPNIVVKINKGKDSKLIVKGNIFISSHVGGTNSIVINLGSKSTLEVGGDFIIGNGVKLSLSNEAVLNIGGKQLESASGITSDSLIMCSKSITIGKDFLCAWGVFITDSDWHSIVGQHHQADVIIGDHVWVANSSSILKGSVIGNNSIVASQSKVINKSYEPNSMLAGIPAKVVKGEVKWSRDI